MTTFFFFLSLTRDFTPRLIRQTIEKQLGLEEASLDASEYKSAIKLATKSALVSACHTTLIIQAKKKKNLFCF